MKKSTVIKLVAPGEAAKRLCEVISAPLGSPVVPEV